MGVQLTLLHRDPCGYGELYDDKLCEHCGAAHNLDGPYCCEDCSHRARSNPDEHMLVDYEEPCQRSDRDDCVHYWECLNKAGNRGADHVCEPGCKHYERDTEMQFTLLRSNAGML